MGKLTLKYSHRLLCGDSTNLADVERLMGGEKADMCFTSPPYNGNASIEYSTGGKFGDGTKKNQHKLYIDNDMDNRESGDFVKFLQDSIINAFLATSGFIFWNISYNANSRFEFLKSINHYLEKLWEIIIWKKSAAVPPAYGLRRVCEFIFCFNASQDIKVRLGKNRGDNGDNIWEISNQKSQAVGQHHACFPVALPEKGIELATEPGESVLDLFGGSGTTMIACEKLNRKCFMMELEPRYCDVICKRYEDYTGKKAVLWEG